MSIKMNKKNSDKVKEKYKKLQNEFATHTNRFDFFHPPMRKKFFFPSTSLSF